MLLWHCFLSTSAINVLIFPVVWKLTQIGRKIPLSFSLSIKMYNSGREIFYSIFPLFQILFSIQFPIPIRWKLSKRFDNGKVMIVIGTEFSALNQRKYSRWWNFTRSLNWISIAKTFCSLFVVKFYMDRDTYQFVVQRPSFCLLHSSLKSHRNHSVRKFTVSRILFSLSSTTPSLMMLSPVFETLFWMKVWTNRYCRKWNKFGPINC